MTANQTLPWWVALRSLPAIGIYLFIVFALGALQLQVTNDASDAMLPSDHEARTRYADYLDRFPSDQGAVVVFENLHCSEAGWALLQEAEASLDSNPLINRTLSLASASSRFVVNQGDVLDLSVFSDVVFPSAQARCEAARNYPPFSDVLVANEGEVTALFLVAEGHTDAVGFTEVLATLVAPIQEKAKALGGRVILTGEPVMSAELSNAVARDSAYVAGVMLLMLVLLYIITRSTASVLAALCLNIFVLGTAYGLMGWFGFALTPATSLVIFLLVPLSSAFVIHAHGYVVRSAEEPKLATQHARKACIMAGLTTGIGCACTGLTDAVDVQSFAIMGVLGLAAATSGVFLFVFPILTRGSALPKGIQFVMPLRLIHEPAAGYVVLCLLVVMTGFGLSRLQIDYSPADYLPLSNSARADYEDAGRWFGRMNIPVMIEADAGDPATWMKLKPLVDDLKRQYPDAFQISWFYDHMSELSKAITEGTEQLLPFPVKRETFEQLALWFSPSDLELFLDDDKERVLLSLQIPFNGSGDFYAMSDAIDEHLLSVNLEGGTVGRASSFFKTGHQVGPDNLRGLAIGALIIFILLLWLFRSFRLAFIGILINGLPVLAGLGVLGLLGIPIDLGSSIVAAMAFGIVLDDSTHLLVRVQQLVKAGFDPHTASIKAIQDLISPIMTTTLVIAAGFCVMFLAEMRPFHDFASLILVTLFTALITDAVILPVLVRRFMRDPLGKVVTAENT